MRNPGEAVRDFIRTHRRLRDIAADLRRGGRLFFRSRHLPPTFHCTIEILSSPSEKLTEASISSWRNQAPIDCEDSFCPDHQQQTAAQLIHALQKLPLLGRKIRRNRRRCFDWHIENIAYLI